MGDRAGNFAVQNSDFLLSIGCRLSIRQVSYNWKTFARAAFKTVVDIDSEELKKPTLSVDLPVNADAKIFIQGMIEVLQDVHFSQKHSQWLEWCQERKAKYPVILKEYWEKESPINPYCLIDRLFHHIQEDEIVVCADGSACVMTFHAAHIRRGQRVYHNSGSAPTQ